MAKTPKPEAPQTDGGAQQQNLPLTWDEDGQVPAKAPELPLRIHPVDAAPDDAQDPTEAEEAAPPAPEAEPAPEADAGEPAEGDRPAGCPELEEPAPTPDEEPAPAPEEEPAPMPEEEPAPPASEEEPPTPSPTPPAAGRAEQ